MIVTCLRISVFADHISQRRNTGTMNILKAKNPIRRFFITAAVLATCGLYGAKTSDAEWNYDLEFLIQLGKHRFDLYADMQRHLMEARYTADRADSMKLANAIYFFSIRKTAEAEKALAPFTKGHALYTRALYIKGTKYAEAGQFAAAEKNFREYFTIIPEAPAAKRARAEFVTALEYYNQVLKELGKGEEAAKLIDKMPPDENLGERELTYLKQLSRIEAEESKLDDGKPVDGNVLRNALKDLKDLFFVRDGISALAAIQVGRIQCLLGRSAIRDAKGDNNRIKAIRNFKDAITAIKQFEDFVQEMERQNSKSTSAMPELLFYKAMAIRGLVEVTAAGGNLKLAAKQLDKGSVTYFRMIQDKYPKSSVCRLLPKQYLLCEEVNEKWKLGAKLSIPKVSRNDLAAVFEPADILLRDKKDYAAAEQRYREAIDKNLKNPAVLKHVPNYMQALAMQHKYKAGKDFIETLTKTFPDQKSDIGLAALMLGAYTNRQMQAAPKDKPNPRKAEQEQLYFWARDLFVDYAPEHPQAAAVAYDLAVTRFNEALKAQKDARNKAPDQQEAANQAARKRIADTIPFFLRVADRFPMHDKGKAALMKAALLYTMLDDREQAIDCFSRFLAANDGSQPPEDVLEAQFRIADLLYADGRLPEAHDAYARIRDLTAAGQPDATLKNSPAFRERALAYIPITVDRNSNLLTARIAILEEQRARRATDIYDLDLRTRALEKQLKALPEQQQNIREQFEELKRVLADLDLDFTSQARKKAQTEAAKPNAAKTEQEFFTLFLTGAAEAAHSIINTETEAITAAHQAIRTRADALRDDIRKLSADLAALQTAAGTQRDTIARRQKRIQDIDDSFAKATKDLEDAEQKRDSLKQTLETSEDDAEIKRTREALAKQDALVTQLQKDKRAVITYAAKQERIACQRDVQNNQNALAENEWKIQNLTAEKALAELQSQALNDQQKPLEARQQFIDYASPLLDQDEEKRLKVNPALKKKVQEIIAVCEKANQHDLAAVTELQKAITAARDRSAQRKNTLLAAQKTDESAAAPLQADWRKQKEEAVTGYRDYLAQYPKGRYFNQCTTQLAGALVDLDNHAEAVRQLNNLLKLPECNDDPGNDKCDAAQTVDVLYNLAKAQTRAKQPAQASGTYERLMNSAHPGVRKAVSAMQLGNLFFIAEQSMTVGAPKAALAASDLILGRVNFSRQAAQQLRPALIEKITLTGARAALLIQPPDPDKARKLIADLLKANPKTAFLYDARFLEAEALVRQGKMDEGIGMLNQLLRRVNDTALANRIRCQVAKLFLTAPKPLPEYRDNAAAIYDSIIDFARENIEMNPEWVKTPEAQASEEWTNTAFLEAARLAKAAGKSPRLQEIKALYRKLFPNGAASNDLNAIN